jgi:protein SCO1/2
LTGTDDEIERAAGAYEVYYQAHLDGRFGGAEGYSVDHTGNVYLMGPDGKFLAYYSQGISPDELAADLMMKVSPG